MVSFYVVSQGALLIAKIFVAIDVDRKIQIFIYFFKYNNHTFRCSLFVQYLYGILLYGFSSSPFNCKDTHTLSMFKDFVQSESFPQMV